MRIQAIVSRAVLPVAVAVSALSVTACSSDGVSRAAPATAAAEASASADSSEPPATMPQSAAAASAPKPPVARQEVFVIKSPFGERIDEYYWLRNDNSEKKPDDIMAYLNAEQAYTEAMMARLVPLQETLVKEIRGRIKEDDSTVPAFDHGYWYWTRFDSGAEYPTYMRRRGTLTAQDESVQPEVLLDVPAMAKGEDYFRVAKMAASPDGTLLAWSQDVTGRRMHTIHFKDLRTGAMLPDHMEGTLESVEWSSDGKSVFYIRQDPVLLQSGPVYRHVLGTSAASDTLVYDEPDKTLFTEISTSRSDKYLLITMEGYDTNELRVVPLDRPDAPASVVFARRPNVRNYVDHCAGKWIIRTNEGARNFRLALAPELAPDDRARWLALLPERADASVDDVVAFNTGIAVLERVDANPRIRIMPWTGGDGTVVPADESAYAMTFGENLDAANTSIRIGYTSMVTPRTTIDVDLATAARTIRKVQPVIGYERAKYETARAWAPSRDGKRIPVSLSWRKDAYAKDGKHAMRIEGYGAYGIPADAEFDSAAVSLMDRGFLIAVAHIRGGADMGQGWYEDGRLMHKKNSFTDFVDATDFMRRDRWCDDRIFATGGSAGGLLMGAVANQAGSHYKGIGLHVPFVDALTTMLDETIPLTTNEWTQWGNPKESKEAYEYILSYSPYDNLAAKEYPAMLVTTGLWDSQVQYYEPAKFVARLRRLRTDSNPFLLHINMEAGHGGKSGRFERLQQAAREQAFFLDLAGVTR
jgi:oligopeptidase B